TGNRGSHGRQTAAAADPAGGRQLMSRRPRRRDSGYALLLIFLMAAVVAISMYIELPRIAFDSQRQKEQLLIERGEQYKRAIELFFKANKKYPASIDELENFNKIGRAHV